MGCLHKIKSADSNLCENEAMKHVIIFLSPGQACNFSPIPAQKPSSFTAVVLVRIMKHLN
jgi:hypothetical protein